MLLPQYCNSHFPLVCFATFVCAVSIRISASIWPAPYESLNASECVYVHVITTNFKRTTFNKFRRCNRFPLSKSIHSLSAMVETPSTKIWLPKKQIWSRLISDYGFSPVILQFSCERPLSESAGFICLSRCAALKSFEYIIHGAHNFLIKQNLRV